MTRARNSFAFSLPIKLNEDPHAQLNFEELETFIVGLTEGLGQSLRVEVGTTKLKYGVKSHLTGEGKVKTLFPVACDFMFLQCKGGGFIGEIIAVSGLEVGIRANSPLSELETPEEVTVWWLALGH